MVGPVFDAPELRLAHALLLSGILMWACRRMLRLLPHPADPVEAIIDLILSFAAAAVLGWLGALRPAALSLVVLAFAAAAAGVSRRARLHRRVVAGCLPDKTRSSVNGAGAAVATFALCFVGVGAICADAWTGGGVGIVGIALAGSRGPRRRWPPMR